MAVNKHDVLLVVRWPIGGIRSFFRYVYKNFDPNKYRFVLIAPAFPETALLLEDLADLDVKYVPLDNSLSDKEMFFAVTRLIRNGNYDLVHSHGFTAGVCSVVGSCLTRTPHIMTLHETLDDGHFIGLKGLLKKSAMGMILSTVDAIQCVSHDARDNLFSYLAILRAFERKVTVIQNGIDIERYLTSGARDLKKELGLPQNSFLIGFLGRYMPEKGFSYLISAFDKIKKLQGLSKRPVLLSFGQDDGYIREEKDNVRRMGLSDSVYFLPFVTDVASTLKGLNVVVMPSLREACGLVAMETMVAGVPLIGTNCVGLREVLRGTAAQVVPPRDDLALSEALVMEMMNPTTAKARDFAMEAAARFQVRERAVEIEKLMLRFLEK